MIPTNPFSMDGQAPHAVIAEITARVEWARHNR
jgi:hypothetical protein